MCSACHKRRGWWLGGAAIILVAGLASLGITPLLAPSLRVANAAMPDGYAELTLAGSAGARTGTVTFPGDLPLASVASTSGSGQIVRGSSNWIPETIGMGLFAGSSQNQPYFSFNSAGQTAGAFSTTTYSFAQPPPIDTWAFALGDIDAESVTVSALDAQGAPVASADLGFGDAFNYCDASPRAAACAGLVAPYAGPAVATDATSVTLNEPRCVQGSPFCDTIGATGWFRPTVSLSSLTIVSRWVAGIPSYQTWFAGMSSVAGRVDTTCVVATGLTVELLLADGSLVETVPVGAAGEYVFPTVLPRAAYQVRVAPLPSESRSETLSPVDAMTLGPATGADMQVDGIYPITGRVTGPGSAGVTVVLSGPGALVTTTTTDSEGRYSFPAQISGDYSLSVQTPSGHLLQPISQGADVGCQAVAATDFVIASVVVTPTPTPTLTPTPTGTPSVTPTPSVPPTPSPTVTSPSPSSTTAGPSPSSSTGVHRRHPAGRG